MVWCVCLQGGWVVDRGIYTGVKVEERIGGMLYCDWNGMEWIGLD
jgi:hypothetical protein